MQSSGVFGVFCMNLAALRDLRLKPQMIMPIGRVCVCARLIGACVRRVQKE